MIAMMNNERIGELEKRMDEKDRLIKSIKDQITDMSEEIDEQEKKKKVDIRKKKNWREEKEEEEEKNKEKEWDSKESKNRETMKEVRNWIGLIPINMDHVRKHSENKTDVTMNVMNSILIQVYFL